MSINTATITDQRPVISDAYFRQIMAGEPEGPTLTKSDVSAYLALVGPRECVGITSDPFSCLLSEALKCKYNTQDVSVLCSFARVGRNTFALSKDLCWLRSFFDLLASVGCESITKEFLEERLAVAEDMGVWSW